MRTLENRVLRGKLWEFSKDLALFRVPPPPLPKLEVAGSIPAAANESQITPIAGIANLLAREWRSGPREIQHPSQIRLTRR